MKGRPGASLRVEGGTQDPFLAAGHQAGAPRRAWGTPGAGADCSERAGGGAAGGDRERAELSSICAYLEKLRPWCLRCAGTSPTLKLYSRAFVIEKREKPSPRARGVSQGHTIKNLGRTGTWNWTEFLHLFYVFVAVFFFFFLASPKNNTWISKRK